MNIKFGTDGWRDTIANNFTYKNVQIVAKGIANYLKRLWIKDCGLKIKSSIFNLKSPIKIIISYDARFCAEVFAKLVADTLIKSNIKVYLTKTDTPTPVATYFIKHKNLQGGIMITASHNPPEFLGIKFKPHYGGSATSEETKEIEEEIRKQLQNKDYGLKIKSLIFNPKSTIKMIDPYPPYLSQLKKIVDFKKIKQKKLNVIIDPMHGAGRECFEDILKFAGCNVINISPQRDVLFGGKNPEPILKNLKELQKLCKEQKKPGFAIDGDGDRIGAFDEKGRFLSSHYIGTLLLEYFYNYKKFHGSVVKSINFTSAIDELTKKYNLKLHIVPVGFKYICEIMRKEKVILGMEESGGIAFQNHIPERDGILSSLYLIEMLANYNLPLHKIFDNLYSKIGNFYYDRIDIKHTEEKKQKIYNYLKNTTVKKINNIEVEKVDTLDGFKYYLKNGDWIMIRISGTEGVLRIYAETREKSRLSKLLEWGKNL